jgi:cell division protein FtsL
LKDDKARSDSKVAMLTEEHERILIEERESYNQELEDLEAEYRELEQTTSSQISSLTQQTSLD